MKILKLVVLVIIGLFICVNAIFLAIDNPIHIGTLKYQTVNAEFVTMEVYGKGRKGYKEVMNEFDNWKFQAKKGEGVLLYRTFTKDWSKPWRYFEYVIHPRWKHPKLT